MLQVLITILPFVVALFVGMNAMFTPILKWAALKLAARRVESEIYKFRMRVGDYAPRRHSQSKAFYDAAAAAARNALNEDGDVKSLQASKSPRVCFSEPSV